ncbi:hypothetical protein QAD02_000429, partial [Eretmocerus hayati]
MLHARRGVVPRTPRNLHDLVGLLENYEPLRAFYKGSVQTDNGIAHISMRDDMRDALARCKQLFVDGTHKVVLQIPRIAQLYIIYFRRQDHGFPGIFIIMSNQTGPLYELAWRRIVQLVPELVQNLTSILMDFERAAINDVEAVLPNAVITGCWFHYLKALQEYWDELDLPAGQYTDILAMAQALPFLHHSQMEAGATLLRDRIDVINIAPLNRFGRYISQFWMKIKEIVSVWTQAIRTNNLLECFNRIMHAIMGNHPKFWQMMDHINVIAEVKACEYAEVARGHGIGTAKELKQIRFDKAVVRAQISRQRGDITIEDFLLRIVYLRRQRRRYAPGIFELGDADDVLDAEGALHDVPDALDQDPEVNSEGNANEDAANEVQQLNNATAGIARVMRNDPNAINGGDFENRRDRELPRDRDGLRGRMRQRLGAPGASMVNLLRQEINDDIVASNADLGVDDEAESSDDDDEVANEQLNVGGNRQNAGAQGHPAPPQRQRRAPRPVAAVARAPPVPEVNGPGDVQQQLPDVIAHDGQPDVVIPVRPMRQQRPAGDAVEQAHNNQRLNVEIDLVNEIQQIENQEPPVEEGRGNEAMALLPRYERQPDDLEDRGAVEIIDADVIDVDFVDEGGQGGNIIPNGAEGHGIDEDEVAVVVDNGEAVEQANELDNVADLAEIVPIWQEDEPRDPFRIVHGN